MLGEGYDLGWNVDSSSDGECDNDIPIVRVCAYKKFYIFIKPRNYTYFKFLLDIYGKYEKGKKYV